LNRLGTARQEVLAGLIHEVRCLCVVAAVQQMAVSGISPVKFAIVLIAMFPRYCWGKCRFDQQVWLDTLFMA
jgi:hypothetical protein